MARANWDKLGILALVLGLTAPFSLHAASRMTLLRMGEERAQSFGVDVRRLRLRHTDAAEVLTRVTCELHWVTNNSP